jgi:hypothetical protein
MRRPGRRKGTKKTGGRKRGTLNKATVRRREARAKKSAVVVEARETFVETAQQFEDEAARGRGRGYAGQGCATERTRA